jgi:hypothetical protein
VCGVYVVTVGGAIIIDSELGGYCLRLRICGNGRRRSSGTPW